jgi:hypothetical protein
METRDQKMPVRYMAVVIIVTAAVIIISWAETKGMNNWTREAITVVAPLIVIAAFSIVYRRFFSRRGSSGPSESSKLD